MASNEHDREKKPPVPAELRRRMQTEHGDWLGFRMIAIGNLYSYEPHLIVAKKYGLLEDDLTVLAHLYDWGSMTANVICALAGRPKNSISRAVTRLTNNALITAKSDEVDRRRFILDITDKGRTLYEAASQPFRLQEEKMFGVLSKKEAEQLDKLMLKVLQNWSKEFTDE